VKNIDKEEYGLGYIGRSFDCDKVNKRILVNTGAPNIEGWYRVTENFTVPTGAKLLKLIFYPGMSGSYFDDIRILPAEANMKSYVYDIKNRMTAELDENNYATFFDYDDQGNLIRVRKETERGIITVNESRIYLKDQ
jgi:YD repeat-containing protein